MNHDFTTVISRKGVGAMKWEGMYRDAAKRGLTLPEGIVPFSAADMEFKCAPEIAEGLAEFARTAVFGYTAPTDAYYEAALNWQRTRHGWDPKKEWIVLSPGVVPAIANCVKAFTEPGDGVIIMTPVYYPFYSSVESNGRVVVRCPLINTDGTYTIDFDLLERLCLDPANKMLILCSPHNPVGRVWTREELAKLAELTLAGGVFVVSDEIHNDLILPGYRHTVLASISPEMEQNSVICTAPSKTFNLAGMEASNIYIPSDEKRARYQQVVGFTGLNIMGMKACELAYTRAAGWLDDLCLHLDKNRKLSEEFFAEKLPMIKVTPLEGTYLQWWDFRALGMEPDELETFMIEKAYLFLDEGKVFGVEGNGFERMNLACPESVLLAALERLERAIRG